MFPYPIARPQNCDIQIFYGNGSISNSTTYTWNKPIAASHVYMLLIGAGGVGDGSVAGGSGNVTVWYGAAQNVPNSLLVSPALNQNVSTYVESITSLLVASSSSGPSVRPANTKTAFGSSGFYRSVGGQDNPSTDPLGSPSTFLNAGANNNGVTTTNYGYENQQYTDGFLLMQPILVGVGASNNNRGGIGCGGGYNSGAGGSGMVLIASW